MMRSIISVFATVAIFMVASAANAALTFSVSGENLNTGSTDLSLAAAGDVVRLDIEMRNTNGDQISALEAAVFDIDPAGLVFQSGEAAGRVLSTVLGGIVYSGGIDNTTAGTAGIPDAFGNPTPVSLCATCDVLAGGTQVKWFGGLSTAIPSPSADGTQDLGIGGQTGLGGLHAQITFTVIGVGSNVTIGVGAPGLGAVIDGTGADVTDQATNATIQIGAVPEPGTALLMGLGLSGLSLAGRRR